MTPEARLSRLAKEFGGRTEHTGFVDRGRDITVEVIGKFVLRITIDGESQLYQVLDSDKFAKIDADLGKRGL
jgi:hypothetical protein